LKGTKSQSYKKYVYLLIGTISLTIALIGMVFPVIPSIPLLLFSAWCYYRGSDKLHIWLINHITLGPLIEDYNKRGMSKTRKTKIIVLSWIPVILSVVLLPELHLLHAGVFVVAVIITARVTKIKKKSTLLRI
jgi:uncharacterized protein